MKPYLASVDGLDPSLPFHPTLSNPVTGDRLRAIYRTKAGRLVWPVMGGSQPYGDPAANPAGQPGLPGQPMQQSHGPIQIPVLTGGQAPNQQYGQNPYTQPLPNGQTPVQQVPQYQYAQQPQQPYPFLPAGFPGTGQPQQQQQMQVQQPPQYGVPSPLQFAMQHAQPQQGQAGQQPQGQQNGQPAQQGQGGAGDQNGQQGQPGAGGQQNGAWDRPYPQGVAVESMTDPQKIEYWKYHSRKNEALASKYSDYDQVKAQFEQLRAATATEWQRAQMEAENRGAAMATQRAAAQLVQFAFQTAAQGRTSAEAINAQLGVLAPERFMHNGQVNLDAVKHFVDVTWPAQQNQPQSLWMQPGQMPGQMQQLPGQPGQQAAYLQPGAPGYAQQPTFGPSGQPVPGYGQPAYGQQYPQQGYQVPGAMPGQPGFTYPQPGVPQHYPPMQQQPQTQQVVSPAGMAGIPSLTPGGPQVTDFGQGAGATNPMNGLQAGASVAAARHGGKTRSQQLASSQTSR